MKIVTLAISDFLFESVEHKIDKQCQRKEEMP